jgi:hypothetical protein
LAAHSNNFHDFVYRVFMLCNQAHNQQTLARPVRLRFSPGLFDLLYYFLSKFRKCSRAENEILLKSLSFKVKKLLAF